MTLQTRADKLQTVYKGVDPRGQLQTNRVMGKIFFL